MSEGLEDKEKLPRVTSFASSESFISPDFFRKALPLLNKANIVFDWIILALVLFLFCGVGWLSFMTDYGSAYISDGILGCQVEPLVEPKGQKVRDGIENKATGNNTTTE